MHWFAWSFLWCDTPSMETIIEITKQAYIELDIFTKINRLFSFGVYEKSTDTERRRVTALRVSETLYRDHPSSYNNIQVVAPRWSSLRGYIELTAPVTFTTTQILYFTCIPSASSPSLHPFVTCNSSWHHIHTLISMLPFTSCVTCTPLEPPMIY